MSIAARRQAREEIKYSFDEEDLVISPPRPSDSVTTVIRKGIALAPPNDGASEKDYFRRLAHRGAIHR